VAFALEVPAPLRIFRNCSATCFKSECFTPVTQQFIPNNVTLSKKRQLQQFLKHTTTRRVSTAVSFLTAFCQSSLSQLISVNSAWNIFPAYLLLTTLASPSAPRRASVAHIQRLKRKSSSSSRNQDGMSVYTKC